MGVQLPFPQLSGEFAGFLNHQQVTYDIPTPRRPRAAPGHQVSTGNPQPPRRDSMTSSTAESSAVDECFCLAAPRIKKKKTRQLFLHKKCFSMFVLTLKKVCCMFKVMNSSFFGFWGGGWRLEWVFGTNPFLTTQNCWTTRCFFSRKKNPW